MKWISIAAGDMDPAGSSEAVFLPSQHPNTCRFCQRPPETLTFKKAAHALPELLGNHYFLTHEECDDCNSAASALEDDLGKHLTVARVVARAIGKKGPIKYRYGGRPSSITANASRDELHIDREVGDDSVVPRRTRDGISYRIRIPSYRPLNVARALARIVFMLVPESQLIELEHVRKWIRQEATWERPTFDEAFLPGPGLARVAVSLDKNDERKPGEPSFRLFLAYGTALFNFHLPGPDMTIDATPDPPGIRSPYPPHHAQWRRYHLNGLRDDFVARGQVDTIDFFVPALAEMPAPSHDEIATHAYFRWLARGGPAASEGAIDDWLEAEQELLWAQVDLQTIDLGSATPTLSADGSPQ